MAKARTRTGSKKRRPITRKTRARGLAELPLPPFWRQQDFYHPLLHNPRVLIIGAGGIGSPTTVALAKLGVSRIRVMDHDVVAAHNVPTTLYRAKDRGRKKVDALFDVVKRLTGVSITPMARKYKAGAKLPDCDVLILGVDNLDVRRELFEQAKAQGLPFLIDGRIGGQNIRVYALRPNEAEARHYDATLIPQSQVMPLPCTAQQVVDVGWMTASLVTRALRQWVAQGKFTPEIILNVADLSITQAPVVKTKPDIEDLIREANDAADAVRSLSPEDRARLARDLGLEDEEDPGVAAVNRASDTVDNMLIEHRIRQDRLREEPPV